jgi:serine/threonine-protein kinase
MGPGDVIAGKYRVERVLGSGGMGVVLAAHLLAGPGVEAPPSAHGGGAFAIKLLRPGLILDAEILGRFAREAAVAQQLQSQHVCRVYEVGALGDGSPFMVMERLEGCDLGRLLSERGPLLPHDAVSYVLQACEAMTEAHAKGVVHRDLKPTNLFLARRTHGPPIVKVLDFGVSKLVREDAARRSLTEEGVFVGSGAYMAPEQARDAKTVDGRCDVWSLGVVLHQLVSNRLPFEGASAVDILAKVLCEAPVPLRRHRPDASLELELVVRRCLSKELVARYPDVPSLAADLVPLTMGGTLPLAAPGLRAPEQRRGVSPTQPDDVPPTERMR